MVTTCSICGTTEAVDPGEFSKCLLRDIMEERKWFEELPDLCPPSDAMACSGVFYRIAEGDPVKSLDFFSQRRWHD